MVSIRLARGGAKKRPFYEVVVTDSKSPRDGRIIERLGLFNPVARGQSPRLRLNLEKVDAWVANGAQMSNRVVSLVKEQRRSEQAAG